MSKKRKGRNFRPTVISLGYIPIKSVDPERERQLEEFRQMFREAYPDAAKFIESIHVIPRKPEFYLTTAASRVTGSCRREDWKQAIFPPGITRRKGGMEDENY